MNQNFKISSTGIEMELDGHYYDLHNDYYFLGILKPDNAEVAILFKSIRSNLCISIDFIGVSHLSMSSSVWTGSRCYVEEIGYKSEHDIDLGWLSGEDQRDPLDHLVFVIENGMFIRISADTACLVLVERKE